MFLSKNELKTVADINLVDKITNTDDTIIDDIIAESISIMSSYMLPRYDAQTVFAKTGDQRHRTVLKYLKDIAIYEVYTRHTRNINEAALTRYENAMRWLEKLNKGEFSADLPVLQSGENPPQTLTYGSNNKYSSKF